MARACGFYSHLFDWPAEGVETRFGTYQTLGVGELLQGGVVECATERALWLPYVEVDDIHATTRRAAELGARVQLMPREGPAGWRSAISAPAGAEIALWQPKG